MFSLASFEPYHKGVRPAIPYKSNPAIPYKKCHPERLGSFVCERCPESKDPYLVNPFASRRFLMCNILIALV